MPFPLTLVAVMAVGALVVILCVLGGVVSGFFGLFGGASEARTAASPTVAFVPPPPRPMTDSFDDGQWVVGVDILPGLYETTVPVDSPGCAWEHASSADGTVSSIIETGTANDNEKSSSTSPRPTTCCARTAAASGTEARGRSEQQKRPGSQTQDVLTMLGWLTGLEPATPGTTTRCSTS